MKFTFTCVADYEGQPITKTIVETDAETLPQLIEAFEHFLRGSGFNIEMESIEIKQPLKADETNY